MWSKLPILLAALLLERANAAGCGFCQGGSVKTSDEKISISSPYVMNTCEEWQRDETLTADFAKEACDFIAPFFEAICECTSTPVRHNECNLCGSDDLEFKDPRKGLVIPNANNQHILCHTIFDGVKAGAVPASDCRLLTGIAEFCGGCESVDVFSARNIPSGRNPAAAPEPVIANFTPQPTMETFVGEIAKFPDIASDNTLDNAMIAEAMTLPPVELSEVPSDAPSMGPTVATSSPSTSPSEYPSDGPSLVPSTSPSESPTDGPSKDPSVSPSESPTDGPSKDPSISPSEYPSDGPSLDPSMNPSASPTVTESSDPTSSPSTNPSEYPSDGPSLYPSTSPTMSPSESPAVAHSSEPTIELIVAMNLATPSQLPSDGPSLYPSMSPSESSATTTSEFLRDAIIPDTETAYTCDLCPGGTLEHPSKLMSLIAMDDKTVTKTCGALLWDARAGKNDLDQPGCTFVQPFFGAICGCSTFTPFSHTDKIEHKVCKLCDKHDHVFQAVHKPLPIPGSENTKITCGGVYAGAVDGAVTDSECKALATIADHCGGCGTENVAFYEKYYEEALIEPEQQCVDCLDEKESSMYVYKDFGRAGTTFHNAFSAPSYCNDKEKPDEQKDCKSLHYPELEGCVLAPITSFEELLRIQAVIPPAKAAYTAVQKDSLVLKTEAKECYESDDNHGINIADIQVSRTGVVRKEKCKVENWMEGLTYGLTDSGSNAKLAKLTNVTRVEDPCASMTTGWTNYKTGTDVPSELWANGQLSYCNLGPVQDVGAVWAVEPEGKNYGDLRDVSMNWPLPGAVYKCCKTIYSCFEEDK